ncbi:MAG TPA: hypothetical protein VE442_23555 [Jatrophihabitans sp.]|nr:hypothetical protein [Jatrophihabitans sp.]
MLALAVLIAAALVYELTRKQSTSPAGQPTGPVALPTIDGATLSANSVLLADMPIGLKVGPTGDVTFTAELFNTSDSDLTVDYPVRLLDLDHALIKLVFAEVAAKSAGTSLVRPPRLTRIRAHQHVELWLGMHIKCAHGALGRTWPTARSTIAVPLAGFPAAATFSFADVFGSELLPRFDRMCPAHGHI